MTMDRTEPPLLAAALDWVEDGWTIFPAPRGEKKSYKSAQYSGGVRWGATRDPEQVRRDFQRWPDANIGVPTGEDNDVFVVEADTLKGHAVDGIASLRRLEEEHGELPPTLTAESPSGSLHYYFNWPDGIEIRNSASIIGPGIDIRAAGGMVLVPPSVRGDGTYQWVTDSEIADAPQWLIDLAVAASKGNGKDTGCLAGEPQAPIERIRAAFAVIPNDNRGWDSWNTPGLALFHATGGSDDGLAVFHAWSSKSKKYNAQSTADRWEDYKTCPPTRISAGSVFHWANEASPRWEALVGMPLEQAMKIGALIPLSVFDYEMARKEAAEELGMRTSVLDDMVDRLRPRGTDNDDDGNKQGSAISLPEPEPWPEEVDGAELLDDITAALKQYVIMTEHACHATVLWCVHTYLLDCFLISPRLAIRSVVPRCGKTTLLDVLGWLVWRALPAANVSAASLFRVVEAYRPALLIDEADTFLKDNEELRGVLNSGHRKGGQVLRTVGDDFEVRSFSTYSACAIALIGRLPDTLADRSVTVDLKRKLRSEVTESFRIDRIGHLEVLARKTARWAADNAAQIAGADPIMPDGLFNRAADNWRPLFAIAGAAGGEWPKRVRVAAGEAGSGGVSLVERLLGDIRDIFAERNAKKVNRAGELPSADLVITLIALEGHPWAELGKSRKPLTQNGLARLLKPLGIAPENTGPKNNRVRGYLLSQFTEAFARYLAPETPSEGDPQPHTRTQCDEQGTSDISQPPTAEAGCAVGECEKPNNDGLVCGCAVADPLKRGFGEESSNGDDQEAGKYTTELNSQHDGNLETGKYTIELNSRRVRELADWYIDQAADQQTRNNEVDPAELAAGLRQVLSEEVPPEFVEVELRRVMVEASRV